MSTSPHFLDQKKTHNGFRMTNWQNSECNNFISLNLLHFVQYTASLLNRNITFLLTTSRVTRCPIHKCTLKSIYHNYICQNNSGGAVERRLLLSVVHTFLTLQYILTRNVDLETSDVVFSLKMITIQKN